MYYCNYSEVAVIWTPRNPNRTIIQTSLKLYLEWAVVLELYCGTILSWSVGPHCVCILPRWNMQCCPHIYCHKIPVHKYSTAIKYCNIVSEVFSSCCHFYTMAIKQKWVVVSIFDKLAWHVYFKWLVFCSITEFILN